MSETTKFGNMIKILTKNEYFLSHFDENVTSNLKDDEISTLQGEALGALIKELNDMNVDSDEVALSNLTSLVESSDYESLQMSVDPFGITLMESPISRSGPERTGTGSTRCTFSPWDGCSPDFDG